MRKLLVLLCLIPLSAMAQEGVPPECRVLKEHVPDAGVAYQPGVDVYGKPVVPADINADPMGLNGQSIVIPLSIDMAKRLQGQNIPGLDMTSTLGFIEVAPNGRVTYNGQDLTGQVHMLCDQKPQETAAPADGQTPPDAVEYAPVKKKPKGAPVPKPVTPNYPSVETPALKAPAPKAEPKKEPAQGEPIPGELIQGGDYREEGYE